MTNRDRILAKKLIEYVNKNRPLRGATAAQVYEQIRELCGKYGYNLPSLLQVKGAKAMINPKSLENLQPFDQMDADKHKELSRRGGIASAKARRRQKEQREAMHAIMYYGGAIQALLDISEMSPAQIRKLIKKSR